jgi:SAM-dependent methyltransferase
MSKPDHYTFQRYLEAKKRVDDRSLNRIVWERLQAELQGKGTHNALRVLEIGAGIGTMFERLVDWGLLTNVAYTAIDFNLENIRSAREHVSEWGYKHGWRVLQEEELTFTRGEHKLELKLQAIDLYDFIDNALPMGNQWDLLVAHAFLDLVDLPNTLPDLFSLLIDGGLYYFTLNFDGVTILEPGVSAGLDEKVLFLYHRSMDERNRNGRAYGDSQTGRHLFTILERSGSEVLAAGASDWVVYPISSHYQADERYFLHTIIHTIHQELSDHPDLAQNEFSSWVERRHDQVERGELIFIAHQLDFVGRVRKR